MGNISHLLDLAQEIYSFLAHRFPVCCRSDEFVFFPQVVENIEDWSRWDDLSPESADETVKVLRKFGGLPALSCDQVQEMGLGTGPLVRLIGWVLRTLEEQFAEVRSHATQPTFILTVASVGILQALQSGRKEAVEARLGKLPDFLERSSRSLDGVPELYRTLGLEMTRDLTAWLRLLGGRALVGPSLEAVSTFGRKLTELSVKEDFRLDPDLLERVVSDHTGSGLGLREALLELGDEAEVAGKLLSEEARNMGHPGGWESMYSSIRGDHVPAESKIELIVREMRRLKNHCIRHGFIRDEPPGLENLYVEPLPRALSAIRAADSYNARPGNPFQGGDFHIFEDGSLGHATGAAHPVFRMTVAHEAYPGHHLLDCFRWNNPDPLLRPVEYPLYYEGWACFGEDLMFLTGAFDRPYDRMILLRRRFLHAVRGKVELELNSGVVGLKEAARSLVAAGFSRERAEKTVRKYALRPAYQMCYTVGRRNFQRLFENFGERDVPGFVNTVLKSGELLFKDLERALKDSGGGEKPVSG